MLPAKHLSIPDPRCLRTRTNQLSVNDGQMVVKDAAVGASGEKRRHAAVNNCQVSSASDFPHVPLTRIRALTGSLLPVSRAMMARRGAAGGLLRVGVGGVGGRRVNIS